MSGHMPLREVLEERARRRGEVVEMVRAYAEKLGERLGRVSVVLFGSYARGDFNLWSDIDVIIVSESFKGMKIVERCTTLGDPPERLSSICWTPEEAAKLLKKSTWIEALKDSVVIRDDYGLFPSTSYFNSIAGRRSV